MHGKPLETDTESAAEIYLLGADERPADNIYGEQPYSDPSGRWVAIRYFPADGKPGGLAIVDLTDGSRREVLSGDPGFPAFHAWGEYLYFQETVNGQRLLRRCRYDSGVAEDAAALPPEKGRYSYGTVSPDHRFYAVSVRETEGEPSKVHLHDLSSGGWRLLLDKPGYHAKHEQFSRDGRNCVLIQLNRQPDVREVLLGEIDSGGAARLFAADQPHTPRPTGHESWIGEESRIFFSTRFDTARGTNIWTAKSGADAPVPVLAGERCFGHVGVSRCGRYWIGDTEEDGFPVYMGSFASGRQRRLLYSRTVYDGEQWAHAHPYLTADNRWLIFNSTRDGRPRVYGARLAPGWLEEIGLQISNETIPSPFGRGLG